MASIKKTILATVVIIFSVYLLNAPSVLSFYDVAENYTNFDAIRYAKENDIVAGYPDGSFKPDKTINRAEFTKIIIEAAYTDQAVGTFCFPDVKDEWFAKYVCTAKRKGVIAGYPDGTFRPGQEVNFVEAAKIIVMSFGYVVSAPETQDDETWYRGFVRELGNKNSIPTTINKFEKEITRGEMVEMIYRLRENITTRTSFTYESLAGPEEVEEIEEPEEIIVIEQPGGCSERITFNYPPVNLEKITHIEPMGSLHGEHVTPIDHQYYQNFNNEEANIEVYAPADGVITNMQHMGSFVGDSNNAPMDDYRLVIENTCSISMAFIHIDKLSDKIMEYAPEFGEYNYVNVPVEAGELIGWFDNNVDFNVVDKDININLINPESYKNAGDRIHISDPFDYFNESIKPQLIAKSLRTSEPYGGTIDYDIDGKLVGTWFKENTNGWDGINQERYWADHLAIVPNSIDPEHISFSVGTFEGRAQQFGVKGNSPDPAGVSVDTGLIKYELVEARLFNGNTEWDFRNLVKNLEMRNYDQVLGIALVQMLEDRKLRVEVFPGKTAGEVAAFTESADTYIR